MNGDNVVHIEDVRNIYKLVKKPEGKGACGRHRSRWDDEVERKEVVSSCLGWESVAGSYERCNERDRR
jgi:hypothetical protein